MTATAEQQFWRALGESREKWGLAQMERYRLNFLAGLQNLAENHLRLRTVHRQAQAAGSPFELHLIEHRYVGFQAYSPEVIIVTGIFCKTTDLPARLQELTLMTESKIAAIRQMIENRN